MNIALVIIIIVAINLVGDQIRDQLVALGRPGGRRHRADRIPVPGHQRPQSGLTRPPRKRAKGKDYGNEHEDGIRKVRTDKGSTPGHRVRRHPARSLLAAVEIYSGGRGCSVWVSYQL